MRRLGIALLGSALLIAFGLPVMTEAGAADGHAGVAGKLSVEGPANNGKKPGTRSSLECTVTASTANTKLDCDDPFPNNEPQIAVDASDPRHMIASSNDYGTCCDEFYTTFDGGQTWKTGNMSNAGPGRIGSDPVTAIDVRNRTAIHASLSFYFNGHWLCQGDVVVSLSTDGGVSWERPVMVDDGVGCEPATNFIFNDKEWIVTDNNPTSPHYGRTYLTWTRFVVPKRVYSSSPIFEAHSDDGGRTWSEPHEISGSNAQICTFQSDGEPPGHCDENQFSVPTVAPDGTVYVAFQNDQNQALWETGEVFDDQYLVVKSDDGGVTWSAPVFVAGLEDGSRDYPINVDGRQTLTGYQVRVNSGGNIVADPRTGRLSLVFSDNREGTHDSDSPVTNTNVYLMASMDGTTWTGPTLVDGSTTDQWFPWADVNPVTGSVDVVYNDRAPADVSLYNATIAVGPGGGPFTHTIVSTASSHPTDSLFFAAGVPGCERCAVFNGDYISVAVGSDGKANVVWTDMRDMLADHFAQYVYFAQA